MKITLISGASSSFQSERHLLFTSRKGIENTPLSFMKSVARPDSLIIE